MEQYTISWVERGEERVEGPFEGGDAATDAARRSANVSQRPVRVLRHDGSVLLTIHPEAPTIVSLRRARS